MPKYVSLEDLGMLPLLVAGKPLRRNWRASQAVLRGAHAIRKNLADADIAKPVRIEELSDLEKGEFLSFVPKCPSKNGA